MQEIIIVSDCKDRNSALALSVQKLFPDCKVTVVSRTEKKKTSTQKRKTVCRICQN